jgi:uncharacterized peroxidase-related enzyme
MARLPIADRTKLPAEFKERFEVVEKSNGYIPNSYLVLAHRPPILKAFMDLSKAVIRDEGTIDRGFRFLIAYVSSRTAGCQYCQAHNMKSADRWGIPEDRLAAVWDYETSPLFSPAEKAALRFAQCGSAVPNAVDDATVEELKRHYSMPQIVEIASVVALFGWLNRFNDSLATELDDATLDWAVDYGLAQRTGWDPAPHLPAHWKERQGIFAHTDTGTEPRGI